MTVPYPYDTKISLSFFLNNVKKVFFTLNLNVFTLLDSLTSSGKPFKMKAPKYNKHLTQSFSP